MFSSFQTETSADGPLTNTLHPTQNQSSKPVFDTPGGLFPAGFVHGAVASVDCDPFARWPSDAAANSSAVLGTATTAIKDIVSPASAMDVRNLHDMMPPPTSPCFGAVNGWDFMFSFASPNTYTGIGLSPVPAMRPNITEISHVEIDSAGLTFPIDSVSSVSASGGQPDPSCFPPLEFDPLHLHGLEDLLPQEITLGYTSYAELLVNHESKRPYTDETNEFPAPLGIFHLDSSGPPRKRNRREFRTVFPRNNTSGRRGVLKCDVCRKLRRKCIFEDVRDPCNHCMGRGLRCTANDKNLGKAGRNNAKSSSFIPGAGIMTLDLFPDTQETIKSQTDMSTMPSPTVEQEHPERRPSSRLHSPPQVLSPTQSTDGFDFDICQAIERYYEKEKQNRQELYDHFISLSRGYEEVSFGTLLERASLSLLAHNSHPRREGVGPLGKKKCVHCRRLKHRCDFPVEEEDCKRCKRLGNSCGEKSLSALDNLLCGAVLGDHIIQRDPNADEEDYLYPVIRRIDRRSVVVPRETVIFEPSFEGLRHQYSSTRHNPPVIDCAKWTFKLAETTTTSFFRAANQFSIFHYFHAEDAKREYPARVFESMSLLCVSIPLKLLNLLNLNHDAMAVPIDEPKLPNDRRKKSRTETIVTMEITKWILTSSPFANFPLTST